MDEADAVRGAVGRLLQVRNAYQLAEDTIKVSQPLRRQLLAQNFQTVNLSVVDVPASQFTAAAPTKEAMEAQFKKYADVSPDDADKSPYGYGYRFPDRVKLQAIELPAAGVRAAAGRFCNSKHSPNYTENGGAAVALPDKATTILWLDRWRLIKMWKMIVMVRQRVD